MLYYFKEGKNTTETQKRICTVYGEGAERVKSGLRRFLLLLTFWPDDSLVWGCLMHWKMLSSTLASTH